MKNLVLLILIPVFIFAIYGCSSSKSTTYINSKYFKILARADDDPLFVKIQDEMDIYPRMNSYTIIVDIRSDDEAKQKIIIGDPDDNTSIKRQWNTLSKSVREGLIKWDGSNKTDM